MNDIEIYECIKILKGAPSEIEKTEVFEKLTEEFKFLLYAATAHFFRRYKIEGITFQDVFCDVLSIFYERVLEYDLRRKKTFRSYVSSALYFYFYNFYCKSFKKRNNLSSLDDLTETDQMFSCKWKRSDNMRSFLLSLTVRDFLQTHLDDEDFQIYTYYYIERYTQQEIAQFCGKSQAWVCLTLQKIAKDIGDKFKKQFVEGLC